MKSRRPTLLALSCLALAAVLAAAVYSQAQPPRPSRQDAQKMFNDGNYNDAYQVYLKRVTDPQTDARTVGDDLRMAVQCLQNLGRQDEIDKLLEDAVAAHAKNWRLLRSAASVYLSVEHFGYMIGGEFRRGHHRGGGKMVNSMERDRVRALQLFDQARPLAVDDDEKPEVGAFFLALADALLYDRGADEAWRLQYLTNLDELPDYDEGWPHFGGSLGAPVDAEGKPVFHSEPKSWDDAQTDGERWRSALAQAAENAPALRIQALWRRADFSWNQFGVQTMQSQFWPLREADADEGDEEKDESGVYAVHTLDESETIARLAIGIRRFALPDEHNHIKLYQRIAEERSSDGENALDRLARVFENRRQYPKAAEYWRRNIERFGDPHGAKKAQRDQIVGNWGQFEATSTQGAGQGATVDYRFRNGKKVRFTAHAIRIDRLLDDLKRYLRSNPGQVDWQKINIENIGYRLVVENERQYLGEQAASWELELDPRENHFDRRITVTTPLQKAGAYLVRAEMDGGNTSRIVLWVADMAVVLKGLSERNLYYVADAQGGAPIPGANLEFFGYKIEQVAGNRFRVLTKNFAETTDANGIVTPDSRSLVRDFQWLVIARSGGRLAYLGFQGVWGGRYYDPQYNQVRPYFITDRPVYRPDQTVHFKCWVRRAQYDQDGASEFAGQTLPIEIYNAKNEKVWSETLKADEYGGVEAALELPGDAALGVYRIVLQDRTRRPAIYGQATFRVEEYKKPEYEVAVSAPDKPVMLGEKVSAKIKANYYFGSPVVNATVKYKITRTSVAKAWYPPTPWDWLYGEGFWWFAYDYPWYPGWSKWVGSVRPAPWWWGGRHNPPELVAEHEGPIGSDGSLEVEIDTALAKAMHGDQDHQYTITAEVRDQSRRTIVGTGQVLVARRPFEVYAWVDRGYYRVGDVIEAKFHAQTLDRRPVVGKGQLKLLKISYEQNDKPVETPVQEWELVTGEDGRAAQKITASESGQYRLSYTVTDSEGHSIEGGYIFTIVGQGFDGREFRFSQLELVPDKRTYQPGEKVRLQINTDRPGATVLVFVRPTNGVYLPPTVVRLKGKSAIHEIDVDRRDMPNFFVEAVTVYGASAYMEAKEVAVPPENRVLDVAVEPSAEEFKPGEKATIKVRLTDPQGKPFVGTTVMSVYDKSVEYISGGGNVEDIKKFFWSWRRSHHPRQLTSLDRASHEINKPGEPAMGHLGVFGHTVADEAMVRKGVERRREANGVAFAPQGRMLAMDAAQASGGQAEFAMPAAPAAAFARGGAEQLALAAGAEGEPGPGAAMVEPTVRTEFADTALWVGSLDTDEDGRAEVSLNMPENLTTWKVKVWAMGHGTRVGSSDAEVVTRKNLILRLQAPRFLVQKDEVTLSANVHNYLANAKDVQVALELEGDTLAPQDELIKTITIEAGGEQRVDWRCKAVAEGQATIRMKALTDEESDATELKIPVFVHGLLKTESWAGTLPRDQDRAKVTINVPAERRIEQTVLQVRFSPSLAAAMVDALPYLADYPYGCTEQTLNRFLPAVITQKTLLDMRLDLKDIRDKRANLNAQEIGDPQQRAAQWQRFERNPVFDQEELAQMVKKGVNQLTDMQNADGGWGWFSGYAERSWPHTTALVVRGLLIARQNDVAIVPGVIERGIEWLKRHQQMELQRLLNAESKTKPFKEQADAIDALVYLTLVDADVDDLQMRDFLYRDRTHLPVYAKAMFGLALEKMGDREKLDMVLRNIEQFLVQDAENETAYLRLPNEGYWWLWHGDEVEANAFYLKLLARTDPKGAQAQRLVKYLLNNRKHATYWKSTRDTALCVEAFADYLKASGELQPNMTVEIWLDGEHQRAVEVTPQNLFTIDNTFLLRGAEVEDGRHEVEIRRSGEGPVYFNVYLTNFTLEDPIERAGLEVKVQRRLFKLTPVEKTVKAEGSRGQALDQRVEKSERTELKNLDQIVSGDLVEVELLIESKNDYEYLVFEDYKAAGLEPVQVRSGYHYDGLGAYQELRDDRVSFFVRALARGRHSIAYRLRAEAPGQFSALPTVGYGMYAPELRGNADEAKVKIVDAP